MFRNDNGCWRGLITALVLATSSAMAQAPSWPDLSRAAPLAQAGPDDVALIVAVERYATVSPIPGAIQNATDWYTYFTRTLGLSSSQVLILRDSEATLERMRRFASLTAGKAKKGSTVWFVFIGHGAPATDGKDGLLVGFDAQQDADSLMARSLRRQELLELLGDGPQARTVALIDACFSGRTSSGAALVPGLQPLIPLAHSTVLASGGPSREWVVLSAAAADQFAGPLPSTDRPAFSYLALGGLRGWADKDGDKNVTSEELRDYVQDTLLVHVRDRAQTPQLTASSPGIVLARGAVEPRPESAGHAANAPIRTPERRDFTPRPSSANPSTSRRDEQRAFALQAARASGILDPAKLNRIADTYAMRATGIRPAGASHFYESADGRTVTENEFIRTYRQVTRSEALDHAEGRRNWGGVAVSSTALAASVAAFGYGIANATRACGPNDYTLFGDSGSVGFDCDPFFTQGTRRAVSNAPSGFAGDVVYYDPDGRIVQAGPIALAVVGGLAGVISGAVLVFKLTQADGSPGENRLTLIEAQNAADEHNKAYLEQLTKEAGATPGQADAEVPVPGRNLSSRDEPAFRIDALIAPTSAALRFTF